MQYTIPEGYDPHMDIRQTEIAIKEIKDYFEKSLASNLNLTRVSAPLFVFPETGLNDNLSGVERPVGFDIKDISGKHVEIVQSLAKWKRLALKRYGFGFGEGLYTDMNAIRRDEELDNLHSIYVDQWDWEKVIRKEDRTISTLYATVRSIYKTFKDLENYIAGIYPFLAKSLPDEITFITSQELEDAYPGLDPKARESSICEKHGAVFVQGIGAKLLSGTAHDGRAPDYDDWTLNGDILFWNPILNCAFELSSMGIRVDGKTMRAQLKEAGCEEKMNMEFHQSVLNGDLPLTIGGGLGQSRICMYFLKRAHIGETQASVWPDDMVRQCSALGINLL